MAPIQYTPCFKNPRHLKCNPLSIIFGADNIIVTDSSIFIYAKMWDMIKQGTSYNTQSFLSHTSYAGCLKKRQLMHDRNISLAIYSTVISLGRPFLAKNKVADLAIFKQYLAVKVTNCSLACSHSHIATQPQRFFQMIQRSLKVVFLHSLW